MAEDQDKKTEDGEKNEGTTEADVAKGKRKRLLLLGGGLLLVVGIGAGAAIFIGGFGSKTPPARVLVDEDHDDDDEELSSASEPAPAAADAAKKDPASTSSDTTFGETYQLRTFNLNLGNPLENSYIRLEIALEYRGGAAQKDEIERRMPQLRDAIVSVVGRKSREFLLGPDGKAQLRRELQIRINRHMSQPIDAVYITDMLIE